MYDENDSCEHNSRIEYALRIYKRKQFRILIDFKHNGAAHKAVDFMITHPERFAPIKGAFCMFYVKEVNAFIQIIFNVGGNKIEVIPPADIRSNVERLTEYNKGWKQDANIGKVNNQKFVQIPFLKFVNMLEYKCQLVGITVVRQQEAYTSKCSFLDNEPIKKHKEYAGKRIKRGLFKSRNGKLINADLNGSLNILKKAVGEFQYQIEVCSTPCVITLR